ncbi:MAG: metal-sulfur cluster assembly factor [Candidatus Aenigmarchaeota archaeon]|nr:metal-sulfur cluster assembly factor [Candidatus Aenigmarchaeota archaeon]
MKSAKSTLKNEFKLKQKALNALKKVIDPELGANIVDLGLIYDIKVNENSIDVLMTLTYIGCPLGNFLMFEVEDKLKKAGFENVNISLTFDPPWTPERMSEKLRKKFVI